MTDPTIDNPTEAELREQPETFEHMLTVLMIMFQDAKDAKAPGVDNDELLKEAFEYGNSWLAQAKEAWTREARIDELQRLKLAEYTKTQIANIELPAVASYVITDRLAELQPPTAESEAEA